MNIHHLNCGSMCPVLFGSMYPNEHAQKMVCHCLLIEHDAGLILVDTGVGTRDILARDWPLSLRWLGRPQFDEAETALHQIEALGYEANDVRHILITHLDLDHAGGLADFPNAKVHTHRNEREAAFARSTKLARQRYLPQQWAHDVRWEIHEEFGETWFGFDGVRPVPGCSEDILLIPLPGHTRGHCGVAIRLADGWILHSGDAYYHRAQITSGQNAPLAVRMFQRRTDTDRLAREKNAKRLAALMEHQEEHVTVFCAHDPVEFQRFAAL